MSARGQLYYQPWKTELMYKNNDISSWFHLLLEQQLWFCCLCSAYFGRKI